MDKTPKRERAVFRAMTSDERVLVYALSDCSFTPGSFDKRFARDLRARAGEDQPQISEKQAALLRQLIHRYRRQILVQRVPVAERHLLETKEKVAPCL